MRSTVSNGYRAWLKLKLGRLMANHNEAEQRTKDIERSIIKKFRKPIWRRFTKAIREYELVQDEIRLQSVFPVARIPC